MRDLTPILMGDPGTHPRRAPTPYEQMHANSMPQAGASLHKRYSKDYEWPVGEVRTFKEKRNAATAQQRLYMKGMSASFTSLKDGTFAVRRVS